MSVKEGWFASSPLDQLVFNRNRLKAEKLINSKVLDQRASKWIARRSNKSTRYSVVFRGSGGGDDTGSTPRQSRSKTAHLRSSVVKDA